MGEQSNATAVTRRRHPSKPARSETKEKSREPDKNACPVHETEKKKKNAHVPAVR